MENINQEELTIKGAQIIVDDRIRRYAVKYLCVLTNMAILTE